MDKKYILLPTVLGAALLAVIALHFAGHREGSFWVACVIVVVGLVFR